MLHIEVQAPLPDAQTSLLRYTSSQAAVTDTPRGRVRAGAEVQAYLQDAQNFYIAHVYQETSSELILYNWDNMYWAGNVFMAQLTDEGAWRPIVRLSRLCIQDLLQFANDICWTCSSDALGRQHLGPWPIALQSMGQLPWTPGRISEQHKASRQLN
jgi:hypothetical protein